MHQHRLSTPQKSQNEQQPLLLLTSTKVAVKKKVERYKEPK
jgi:hypothetical protein